MKKALLIALAAFFTAVAPALAYPPAAANVNFSSEYGVPFGLVLDGRPLTRGVARQVHVDQLVPGLHWADFTLPTPYGGALRFRSRVWLQPGLETSFVLVARPGRVVLQQVDAVALYNPNYGSGYGHGNHGYGGPRHNGYNNGPAPYGQGGYGGNYPSNSGNQGYGNGYGSSNGSSNGNEYDDDQDDDNNPTGGYGNGSGNGPGGAGYFPGSAVSSYRTLPAQDVEALIQRVQQGPSEASKLSTAKAGLGQSSIPAADLKRLLQGFDSEAARVELAKFAYPHVADRQNFARVYDAFDAEASTQEVQQAVASGK